VLGFLGITGLVLAGTNYFLEGRTALEKKDYDRAIACFTKALDVNGKDAPALSFRGLAHAEKGSYDQAIADCTAAIRIDARELSAYIHRSRAYSIGKHDNAAAVADCEHVLRIDPKNADAHYNLGGICGSKGEYDAAIDHLSRAIALDPKAKTYRVRGQVFTFKNDLERALADLDQAIRLDPADPSAYTLRANVLANQKEYDRAIVDANKALQLDAKSALGYAMRGLGLLGKWNSTSDKVLLEKAFADLDAAVKLAPTDWQLHYCRGEAEARRGQLTQAIADFTEALRLEPNTAGVYCARADAFLERRDYVRAFADFNEAIRLEPRDLRIYEARARAYEVAGKADQASADTIHVMRLEFDRTEDPVVRVRNILFVGSKLFTSDELTSQIEPTPDLARVVDDRDKTEQFFRDRGYMDARVASEVKPVHDLHVADVIFHISEGHRYRIDSVTVEGTKLLSSKDILSKVRAQTGDLYSSILVKRDLRIIKDYYASRGLEARVIYRWVIFPKEQPGRTWLTYEVEERVPASSGNPRVLPALSVHK